MSALSTRSLRFTSSKFWLVTWRLDATSKQLQNIDPSEFRLRAGDYRVRFYDLNDSILVIAVKHRREAYR